MTPDLELIHKPIHESFRAWAHGFPHTVAKWHFHPEYELHFIITSNGKFFIGDHIGSYGAGNLILTGPNLPHNWVSELPEGVVLPERDLVLQFSGDFIERCALLFPEMAPLKTLLGEAGRGLQFPDALGLRLVPLMKELTTAQGLRRVELFTRLFGELCDCSERRPLASVTYLAQAGRYMSSTINLVLAYIKQNITLDFCEQDVADVAEMNTLKFTRFFRKHTGTSFIQYVNQERIALACELLMNTDMKVTDICYRTGFNNLSNFNRQFLAHKQMSPSKFRSCLLMNMPEPSGDGHS
ncbi:MAG: AraC family transcriptional regulator [Janthinobacterium sp.]